MTISHFVRPRRDAPPRIRRWKRSCAWDEAAIGVYVGLVAESQYWAHLRQPLPQVEKSLGRLRSQAISVARQLLPTVALHASFQGWYIPEEIDDTTWRTPDWRAGLSTHLHRLS